MFYLTYRPRDLSELDNKKIREQITTILESGNIPHAMAYVGQKGTGKTSTARIFAKAINCLENSFAKTTSKSIEPCNSCVVCQSIDGGASTDIIEMDAASNRGIDEVRDIIKQANYLPMSTRYRVFIIDEAHMITPDAFNALLKTLEEPPATSIFILATTNIEKVPTTIISRCTLIDFGRATQADLLDMLRRVAEKEKISLDPKVAEIIAEHSENSFRDGVKILEELATQEKLTVEGAKEYLGLVGKQDLLEIVATKPLVDALLWIEHFDGQGGNVGNLINNLLEELRVLLLSKYKVIKAEKDIDLTPQQISGLIKLLHEAHQIQKISPIPSLPLEIAVVDFYNGKKDNK